MTKSYEELVGGLGRSVAYRPERLLVREFLAERAARLVIEDAPGGNGAPREFALHDMSMNGVSLMAKPGDWNLETGCPLRVRIEVAGTQVFQDQARVARVEEQRGRLQVGIQLMGQFLDLPKLRTTYEERALDRALKTGPDAWRKHVPAEYREIVEETCHFMGFYQRALERQERRFEELGENTGEAELALAQRCADAIRQPWQEICIRGARSALPSLETPRLMLPYKRYTETMIAPLLATCPLQHGCYYKPLGYPGDYQTMAQIYRNGFEGNTLFQRVFHRLGCEEPLAAGVRTRKDFVRRLHRSEHDRVLEARGQQSTFRATSLGSGLAREVSEYVVDRGEWPGSIHWTLIDQEERALSLSYQNIYRQLFGTGARGSVECLYMSFTQMLQGQPTPEVDQPQDFIYAIGLFDYIHQEPAQELIASLYDKLAPGGLLAICNVLWPNEHFWLMEFAVDWSLIYRTKEDMLRLASKIGDATDISVVAEPHEAYYFLLLRKA